jgi:hypothetical protein
MSGSPRAGRGSPHQSLSAEALRDAGKDASLLEGYTWHCNRHTFCQPARDGRCGPAQHPETRRLAHAVDGTAIRAPRPRITFERRSRG